MKEKYSKIILHLTSGEITTLEITEDECNRLFEHFKNIINWTNGAYVTNNIIIPFMNVAFLGL